MKRVLIFASGSGSNAQRITEYFREQHSGEVVAVLCNNPHAYVQERCKQLQLPCKIFSREQFREAAYFMPLVQSYKPDLIVLAGFLWLIPPYLVHAFPKRIINIHPALLPAYGGKGMYGNKVHEAVIANKEKQSGITIHLVNEEYDKGAVLFQHAIPLSEDDTAETLAAAIHQLEYQYFPLVVEEYLQNTIFES